jgi:hypothetical protein
MQIPANPDQRRDRDAAIKKYDFVLKLFTMDTQLFWTRSQLFLVANAALAGFSLSAVPLKSEVDTVKIYAEAIATITGIILCRLWIMTLRSGKKWTEHWKELLKKWEPLVFDDDDNVYLQPPEGVDRYSGTAIYTAWLFLSLWIILGVFVIICIVFKYLGWKLQ